MPSGFTSGTCATEVSVTAADTCELSNFPLEALAIALNWTVTVVGCVLFGCQVPAHLPLPECCMANPGSPVLKLTFMPAGYWSVTAFPQSSVRRNSRLTGCPRGDCAAVDAGLVSCPRSWLAEQLPDA